MALRALGDGLRKEPVEVKFHFNTKNRISVRLALGQTWSPSVARVSLGHCRHQSGHQWPSLARFHPANVVGKRANFLHLTCTVTFMLVSITVGQNAGC